jgi:hypothetical protein
MRAYTLCLAALIGCVGDDNNTTKDSGNDVTSNDSGSDVISTNDASAEADAPPPFSPASFGADLALWVVGDTVSVSGGNQVDTWPDQSPHKTDLTQSTVSSRPLQEKGVLNNHDVVDFNGNNVRLTINAGDAGTPANLSFGQGDDFVISAVISTAAGGSGSGFVWLKANEICNGSCTLTAGLVFGADIVSATDDSPALRISPQDSYVTAGGALADHSFHLLSARRIGQTTIQLRTDTVVKQANATAADLSLPSAPLRVGAGPNLIGGSFAFRVAEIVAVHRTGTPINDGDIAKIEGYLRAKYKTP